MPLAQLLARGGRGKREVLDAVHALSDAALIPFGLRAYHMNLLSLFGEDWPLEKIARTARAAAIGKMIGGWEYHHHYLPGLTHTAEVPQLEDLPLGQITEILARGRGLAIASFHLGPMRYLPSDLAHAGIPICVPLARDSLNDYQTARTANPEAALWKKLRIVNAEEHGGALALAKTLARGGCVLSTIDGNTGLDGPRGDQRRATVRILGSTARVKTGLIGMAARFGAPILVMIAYTSGEKRHCRTAPVIDPGRALCGDARGHFVEAAVQRAYSFFGAALRAHAEEWSGGDLFHQWRVPGSLPQRDIAEVAQMLGHSLAAGGRLTINHRRIVPLSGEADRIWSDAVSGRCYRLPAEMAALAEQLSAPDGIGRDWLDRHAGTARSRIWAFLCQLASRDAIRPMERAANDGTRRENPKAVREIAHPPMHGTGM
ncbi:hypothetical protein E5A73_16710 [Sphingomonas gei]|uniref:Uncharacterized protein n=1 Tax=Sphingomonas gei TaxID=1395960 RepID=A0A4S1X8S5_9SPHN|nr:hypothetical protein [Sphingomonas gei]TGX52428.1 hypothetical protein E5A73_16710 [Sphingomonas gei]